MRLLPVIQDVLESRCLRNPSHLFKREVVLDHNSLFTVWLKLAVKYGLRVILRRPLHRPK